MIALNSSFNSNHSFRLHSTIWRKLAEWETVYATEAIKFHPLAVLFYCHKVITPLEIVVSMEIELDNKWKGETRGYSKRNEDEREGERYDEPIKPLRFFCAFACVICFCIYSKRILTCRRDVLKLELKTIQIMRIYQKIKLLKCFVKEIRY